MFNVFSAEWLKLKNTKIWWMVIIGALPSNLISFFAFLPRVMLNGEQAGLDIQDMFYRQGMMLVMMGPSIFGLMTGSIFAREYQERTINQLFIYPVSRAWIFAAKLAVVFTLIAISSILSCATVTVTTILHAISGSVDLDLLWSGVRMNVFVCLLSFGTVPVAAALSIAGKSIVPVTVVGIFATIVTVIGVIGHSRGAILFPWLAPYWPVRQLAQNIAYAGGTNPYAGAAMITLISLFLISLAFSLVYYTRADVHSGS